MMKRGQGQTIASYPGSQGEGEKEPGTYCSHMGLTTPTFQGSGCFPCTSVCGHVMDGLKFEQHGSMATQTAPARRYGHVSIVGNTHTCIPIVQQTVASSVAMLVVVVNPRHIRSMRQGYSSQFVYLSVNQHLLYVEIGSLQGYVQAFAHMQHVDLAKNALFRSYGVICLPLPHSRIPEELSG